MNLIRFEMNSRLVENSSLAMYSAIRKKFLLDIFFYYRNSWGVNNRADLGITGPRTIDHTAESTVSILL